MTAYSEISDESDQLTIMPLGAGQEVGRSCILMTYKGKRIIVKKLLVLRIFFGAFLNIQHINSSFHLDHCGGLPFLLLKSGTKAKCFMTHATKAIYRYLLADFVRVSNSSVSGEQSLYTDADIIASLERIDTIDFHQECEINGIKFTAYHAGHVLGAAMFQIEIAGVKVLYTGDFSRQEDRHLMSAEIPPFRPDVLITESTYGIHIHDKREEREFRFTKIVHDIVSRGGRCLIPAFALGRAQELMLILDEYWASNPELHDVPIYYASQLARKCMAVYQTYIHAMNDNIKNQLANNNPFVFRYISNLKSIDHFDDCGPCVVMASPGMMQSGLSRELFENWCTDSRNGVIIAGYCVEGTLAKQILSLPQEVPTMSGQSLALKCSVDYISFSAHTDYQQTSEFIRELRPNHVVLVHGEQNEMTRLCSALKREYEDMEEVTEDADGKTIATVTSSNPQIQFYMPKNCQSVDLRFRGEKIAKVLGSLAKVQPNNGDRISGILVKKNFAYHLMAAHELPTYTELASTVVSQTLQIPFGGTPEMLKFHLTLLAGEVVTKRDKANMKEFLLFNAIHVIYKPETVTLKWESNPTNDMYADAIQNIVIRSTLQFQSGKKTSIDLVPFDMRQFKHSLMSTFMDAFGKQSVKSLETKDLSKIPGAKTDSDVEKSAEVEEDVKPQKSLKLDDNIEEKMTLQIDHCTVVLDLKTLVATCEENQRLANIVQTMSQRLYNCLTPV